MSWFTENKFLAGFAGVMVVGAGALGYLAMGASDDYGKARQEYDEAKDKLKGLYAARPYPMQENVDAYAAREKALKLQINTFQKELNALEIKAEAVSGIGFQDKLKETVARVIAKAGEMSVKLPEKFYMGFEEFQNKPPQDSEAPTLLRVLRSEELAVNLLLEVKSSDGKNELKKIGHSGEEKEKKSDKPVNPEKAAKNEKKLVHHLPFEFQFVTSQEQFQRILNAIVGNKQQFFIVRKVTLKNEHPEAPSKVALGPNGAPEAPGTPAVPAAPATPAAPTAPGTPAPPAPAAAVAAPAGAERKAIFGTETVEATLEIDIVDFADPETIALEKTGGNKQPK